MPDGSSTDVEDSVDFRLNGNPEYGVVTVRLEPDETFLGESGAMSYMAPGTEVKARLLGGFLKAAVRKLVAGESLLAGEYSHTSGGKMSLSPSLPGAVVHHKLAGDELTLTKGTFLACSPDIQLSTQFGGVRSFFSGEGAFVMKASGHGDLFFCSYGAVIEREVTDEFIVDTGHVVAWDEGLSYKVGGMGGIKSTMFSGEGLTMRFSGRGRIWLQTRTLPSFSSWLFPFLRG